MENLSLSHTPPLKCHRKIYMKNVPSDLFIKNETERNLNLEKFWKDKAAKELGETDEIVSSRIKLLRHQLVVGRHATYGRTDDAFLLRFLRAKKFDTDKAYRMIQKYFVMKTQSPELFKVSPPSELKSHLEMQIQYMLPFRDANGRQIYIFRVEKCDPCKCPVETVFRSNVLSLENNVRDPETQIAGLVVLLDMAGLSLGHARFLSPHLAKRTVEVIQEAFPLRFKAFHILHEPFYFDAILAVLKPFLKDKIRKRIHLHGNSLTSMHRHISKDILPFEYGGTQPPFDNTFWRTQILNDEEYFLSLEKYSTALDFGDDESPINGTPTHSISDADGATIPYMDTETEDSEIEDCFYNCEERSFDDLDTKTLVLDDHEQVEYRNFEAELHKSDRKNFFDKEKQKKVEDIK